MEAELWHMRTEYRHTVLSVELVFRLVTVLAYHLAQGRNQWRPHLTW